jgi:cytochrome c biogenesis protein CcdA
MFYKLLEDLRFVIGLLFFFMSAILLFQGIVHPIEPTSENLNLLAGAVMGVFAVSMLVFSWRGRFSDNHK